jgi:dihydroxy-acid dehydratase
MAKSLRSDIITGRLQAMPNRALLYATGVSRSQMRQPMIGIASSFTDLIPGHVEMRSLERFIEHGICAAGGVPFVFGIPGVCDGIAMGHLGMRYSLPSRELIADMVETVAIAHALDGLVLLTNCDKITPGMLMAAARLDVPSVVLTAGPMVSGRASCPGPMEGERLSLVRNTFEAWIKREQGKISEAECADLEMNACPGAGSCQGLYTANTMACLTEALGMSLTGCGTGLASSAKKKRLAFESGRRVVGLVREGVTPRNILTKDAFINAIRLDMATGGSSNTVLHLVAIAREAGVNLDLGVFEKMSRSTPQIIDIEPGGNDLMEDVEFAGGVPAMLHVLRPLLKSCPTVNGRDILRIADAGRPIRVEYLTEKMSDGTVKKHKRTVIRSLDNPVRAEGGIAILKGNLAPDGAVIKRSAVEAGMLRFAGRARVFNGEAEAMEAIKKLPTVMRAPGSGSKLENIVLVIRYEGPKGGPGMPEMLSPTSALRGYPPEILKRVALITDGRFSGGTRGPCIGHIAPEAIEGGPIGLVKNGDMIEIDVPARSLRLVVDERQMKTRRAKWQPAVKRTLKGYLSRYVQLVGSAAVGATLR